MGKIDDDAYNNHNQDIARRLIAQGGLTDEFIAMCSGLSAEEIDVGVGETAQLTGRVNEGASGQVTFFSNDANIATVTEDGTITGVAVGRAVSAGVGDPTACGSSSAFTRLPSRYSSRQ